MQTYNLSEVVTKPKHPKIKVELISNSVLFLIHIKIIAHFILDSILAS